MKVSGLVPIHKCTYSIVHSSNYLALTLGQSKKERGEELANVSPGGCYGSSIDKYHRQSRLRKHKRNGEEAIGKLSRVLNDICCVSTCITRKGLLLVCLIDMSQTISQLSKNGVNDTGLFRVSLSLNCHPGFRSPPSILRLDFGEL